MLHVSESSKTEHEITLWNFKSNLKRISLGFTSEVTNIQSYHCHSTPLNVSTLYPY